MLYVFVKVFKKKQNKTCVRSYICDVLFLAQFDWAFAAQHAELGWPACWAGPSRCGKGPSHRWWHSEIWTCWKFILFSIFLLKCLKLFKVTEGAAREKAGLQQCQTSTSDFCLLNFYSLTLPSAGGPWRDRNWHREESWCFCITVHLTFLQKEANS